MLRAARHKVTPGICPSQARHGVAIAGGEIVGLVPEDALLDAAAFYLRLQGFDEGRVLERRLEEVRPGASEPRHDGPGGQGGG